MQRKQHIVCCCNHLVKAHTTRSFYIRGSASLPSSSYNCAFWLIWGKATFISSSFFLFCSKPTFFSNVSPIPLPNVQKHKINSEILLKRCPNKLFWTDKYKLTGASLNDKGQAWRKTAITLKSNYINLQSHCFCLIVLWPAALFHSVIKSSFATYFSNQ